jgi:hypothetical protein
MNKSLESEFLRNKVSPFGFILSITGVENSIPSWSCNTIKILPSLELRILVGNIGEFIEVLFI